MDLHFIHTIKLAVVAIVVRNTPWRDPAVGPGVVLMNGLVWSQVRPGVVYSYMHLRNTCRGITQHLKIILVNYYPTFRPKSNFTINQVKR